MNNPKFVVSAFALALVASGMANAQATRTWVSGVGDDVNPCSRTAPCKTFAGAISKTAAGGEIDALDPAGYGAVTITKAITIDGGGGQVSSILSTGSRGVSVSAGSTDVVTLRNISFLGVNTGTTGIYFASGKALHIENCSISEFLANGIDIEPTTAGAQTFVSNTVVEDNGGDGIFALGPTGMAFVTIDRSRFENNTNGVNANNYAKFSIRNSAASGNRNAGFLALSNTGGAVMSIVDSTSANNVIGLQSGGGSAATNVRISGVSLFINTSGLVPSTNGTIASFGNNYNSGSGAPNATLPLQ